MKKSLNVKLKPCPFCAGDIHHKILCIGDLCNDIFYCKKCSANIIFNKYAIDTNKPHTAGHSPDVLSVWNTRC